MAHHKMDFDINISFGEYEFLREALLTAIEQYQGSPLHFARQQRVQMLLEKISAQVGAQ